MKTRASFVVEKKRQLSSLPRRFKKAVSNSAFFHCVFSAENTSLIFIHSAQAAITHTAGTRAHRLFLSLQSFARMMFKKKKKNTLLLFLSFFTHTRACINSSQ